MVRYGYPKIKREPRCFRKRRRHTYATPLTVFLVNGFQMRGVITGFDPFVIVLFSEGRQQMIYKHAVSTITPSVPLRLSQEELQ